MVGWLLGFYILATSKDGPRGSHRSSNWLLFKGGLVILFACYCFKSKQHNKFISGRVPTADHAHSWWLYSAATLGDQVASTMTWYPTQSHYPRNDNNAKQLARKRQVSILKWFVWCYLSRDLNSLISQIGRLGCSTHSAIPSGPPLWCFLPNPYCKDCFVLK